MTMFCCTLETARILESGNRLRADQAFIHAKLCQQPRRGQRLALKPETWVEVLLLKRTPLWLALHRAGQVTP